MVSAMLIISAIVRYMAQFWVNVALIVSFRIVGHAGSTLIAIRRIGLKVQLRAIVRYALIILVILVGIVVFKVILISLLIATHCNINGNSNDNSYLLAIAMAIILACLWSRLILIRQILTYFTRYSDIKFF